MRSRRRTTILNLCFQAYSVGIAIVSGVLLVPLYLRHIPSGLYGAWQASGNVLMWMTMLDPGLSAVLQQRVAESYGAKDTKAVSEWIASGLWITAGIVLLLFVVGMTCSVFLGSWMNLPSGVDQHQLSSAFRWSVAGNALMILSFSVTSANQGLQSGMGIGLIYVGVTMLRLVLVLVLVTSGFGLYAIAVPSVAMGLLLFMGSYAYMRRRLQREDIPFTWTPRRLKALGALLSVTSLGRCATLVANNVDLFLVARILGPESVNVLRLTRTAPEMSRMLVERPIAAVQPSLSHLLGSGGTDRAREILLRMLRLIVWLLGLLIGGFVVFNRDFMRLWVGEAFYAGTSINLLLVAAFLVSVGTSMLSNLCFSAGEIRGTSLAGFAQVFLYLPMLWAGGHWFGMTGIVAAGLASTALTQGWYLPRAFVRIYNVTRGDRTQFLRAALPAVVAAALPAASLGHRQATTWPVFVLWVVAFAAGYGTILLLLCTAAREEFRHASTALRLRLSRWRQP
jgi:O-antigen/teichoic acid export membrane protein